MSKIVKIKLKENPQSYRIEIGCDLLKTCGGWAKRCLRKETQKVVIISNAKVFALYGEAVKKSFEDAGFEVFVWKMGDGEKYKNFLSLENALKFFSENKLKRTDAIVALGGGVVGDLAGFAVSIYLRGISFLQIPTTVLAMIDSSVGGKTAVNTNFGKNLIGAFYHPKGVLIDIETLRTLPQREITAGFCEAVKQSVISSRKFFNQTKEFLEKFPTDTFKTHFSNSEFLDNLQKFLSAQVAFKAKIVAGDEREEANRTDSRSRKILNFGHTVAHALEKVTGYKRFRHGEAVAYGMLAAGEISKRIGIFEEDDFDLLNDAIHLTGKLPPTENIKSEEVIKALAFDKKQTSDSLQWILLEAIGKPVILQSRDIPDSIIKNSIEKILKK